MKIDLNSITKLTVVLFVLTNSVFAQSKMAAQIVYTWPDGYDAIGVHWYLYNLTKGAATHWIDINTPGSGMDDYMLEYDLIWNYGEIGHFNAINPWSEGDECIWFGSCDSAYAADSATYGSNRGHTGYVWFSSDSVDGPADPWYWADVNANLMGIPTVSSLDGSGVWIVEFTNPPESGVPTKEYSILGYWLLVNAALDTLPSGAPNGFNDTLGFVPVQGGPGQSTFFVYEFYELFGPGDWTTYHAYHLVFRPETTATSGVCPGYSTKYMSKNSNIFPYDIAIREQEDAKKTSGFLHVMPNPFSKQTKIFLDRRPNTESAELRIHDATGCVVKNFNLKSEICNLPSVVSWDGSDNAGQKLPGGVYFLKFEAGDYKRTKKLTLLR